MKIKQNSSEYLIYVLLSLSLFMSALADLLPGFSDNLPENTISLSSSIFGLISLILATACFYLAFRSYRNRDK